jgi:hypothetical protein
MEVYKNQLILYGTGDIIYDYEGFENPGEERYDQLGGIYIVDVNATSGELLQLKIVPMFMNRLRLERRFTFSSNVWTPYKRYLEKNPNKSKEFCDFYQRADCYRHWLAYEFG